MESLKAPDKEFKFENIKLNAPIALNNGNHFIRISDESNKLYIQTPKCLLKNGIVKTKTRAYSDLMFTNDDVEFIEWIENLETYCKRYIYNNRESWFETDLDENDIETFFTPLVKVYKSGKYLTFRTTMVTPLGKVTVRIYDENENTIDSDDLKEDDNVICALEVQGIKCSARSFQIEIEMKQMLVLSGNDLFNSCILKKTTNLVNDKTIIDTESVELNEKNIEETQTLRKTDEEDVKEEIKEEVKEEIKEEVKEEKKEEVKEEVDNETQNSEENIVEINDFDITVEDFNDKETISLKKTNDIHYDLYKEALKKAKQAKHVALHAYLEAKQIKNTHMLDEIDDSDLDDESLGEMSDNDN
jgi:hypothetical protein